MTSNLVTGNRTARVYLIHEGRDIYGQFIRIVAGTDASMEDAPTVLAAYGCLADRTGHRLAVADPVAHDPNNAHFATFYSKYDLTDDRLAELKGQLR